MPAVSIDLEKAIDLTRTGDIWLGHVGLFKVSYWSAW
jgi:hypothetical protein